jgi:hypothetical protein
MIGSDGRLLIGCVLAVLVPAWLWHGTTEEARRLAGLTAEPFAWPRLLVGHLMSALPLGLLLARGVRTIPTLNAVPQGGWVVLAIAVAGLIALLNAGLGELAISGVLGFVPLLVLRASLAVAAVLPWCVWATQAKPTVPPVTRPGLWLGLGLGLALVPCGLYTELVIESRTATATEWLASSRLARAERQLRGLLELGSDRPVAGQPPQQVYRGLTEQVRRLERRAATPLPPQATPADRFARAEVCIQLDRLDEAADLLRPLTPQSRIATLLLATVERDRGNWAASEAAYQLVLDRLVPELPHNPQAVSDCRVAFEGLAFAARSAARPHDAERHLLRAIETLPSEAAHFHFLLGQHYADGGRPTAALEHLQTAARLDPPTYSEQAETLLRQLRTHTPACWR